MACLDARPAFSTGLIFSVVEPNINLAHIRTTPTPLSVQLKCQFCELLDRPCTDKSTKTASTIIITQARQGSISRDLIVIRSLFFM